MTHDAISGNIMPALQAVIPEQPGPYSAKEGHLHFVSAALRYVKPENNGIYSSSGPASTRPCYYCSVLVPVASQVTEDGLMDKRRRRTGGVGDFIWCYKAMLKLQKPHLNEI